MKFGNKWFKPKTNSWVRFITSILLIEAWWFVECGYMMAHDPTKISVLEKIAVVIIFLASMCATIVFTMWWNGILTNDDTKKEN